MMNIAQVWFLLKAFEKKKCTASAIHSAKFKV